LDSRFKIQVSGFRIQPVGRQRGRDTGIILNLET